MFNKVKIFAGPNTYQFDQLYFEEANEIIVGVDSGLAYLMDRNMNVDFAFGDFDSLDEKYINNLETLNATIVRLNKEKDMTDLTFAIDYLYQNIDYESIEIYGGIGGRVDHFYANINLLKRYDLKFIDNHNKLYVLKKGFHHIDNTHHYISLFALEDVYDLSIQGFRYELDHYYLGVSDSIGVSNEGSGDVTVSKGRLLVMETDETMLHSS